jgi:hypothetical protein
MPNGIFPVPAFDLHSSDTTGSRPSLAVRLRTWFSRDRLDEELADGIDPAASAELRFRAAQLRSHAERTRLANALVTTLGDARRAEPVAIKSRPQRAELRDCADDLLALVLRLRDDRPIDIRGAALTARLLNDGGSPLYRSGGEDLRHALHAARLALDPGMPVQQGLARAA